MNIFTRAMQRLGKKSKASKGINKPIDRASKTADTGFSGHESEIEMIVRESGGVDLPLNEELTDEHGVTDYSLLNVTELDIDLSADHEDITGFPGNVLNINPVKSFSHPADIDLKKLEAKGFITPTNANTMLSNTFRMIKRPILNNVDGKGATRLEHANLIMVTSSLSEEGKSFSAINLALSIAMEKNKRVLLIDADVNKPSHHEEFGIDMEYGLTDLLSGKVDDMSRIMCKTNIPSLSLMFAGTLTSHATELLASQAMEDFVHEISTRYPDRIIIFDSPPLLQTTESSVLASHMGQVVMVVEAEKTLRYQVKKSLGLLSNEIVLMLLNKMREKTDQGNYGYYGYGHQG